MHLYFHIPFCKTKCAYCAFYSCTETKLIDSFVDALCYEILLRKNELDQKKIIQTIYFGGGTPSLLSQHHFLQIFNTIKSICDISKCKEITIEVNPDDISAEYAKMLHSLPFNRISIGIQSTNNERLSFIQRRHDSQQAFNAVKQLQTNGFSNISLDLIFGFPNQTILELQNDLKSLIALQPTHISTYNLTFEGETPLVEKLKNKEIHELDENTSIQMYKTIINTLNQHGYLQYEVSNFAKKGKESIHNSCYWTQKPYIGYGPAAHSYDGKNIRRWNLSDLKKYIQSFENQTNIPFDAEILSQTDLANELLMTRLRTKKGLNIKDLTSKTTEKELEKIEQKLHKFILSDDIKKQNQNYKLTKKGFLRTDYIISELFL